jgi:hypothetical protein
MAWVGCDEELAGLASSTENIPEIYNGNDMHNISFI